MKEKNNIERSYSEKFQPSSVKNEGWNEPSDGVWENISSELYAEEKSKFGFLPFLLMSLLAMSVILSIYLYNQNNKLKQELLEASSVENPIALSQNPIGNTSTSPILESSSLNSASPKTSKAIPIKQKVVNTNSKQNVTGNISAVISQSPNIDESEASPVQNIDAGNYDNTSNITEVINDSNVIEELLINTPQREKISVQSLNSRSNILAYENEMLSDKEIVILEQSQIRRPHISFLPNIALGILKTSGIQETALTELIDKEYGNIGMGMDFLYTMPISNSFDFTMGLGVESFNFATEYDITLPYNTEDETLSGESGYIDFEHSLPTAFGNTDTALRLNRKRASDALDESNVNLDFNTSHNFVTLSVPLGINYRLGKNKSFFNIGFRARPSYILNAQSAIRSVYSYHSEIDAVNNESISTYGEVRKLNVSLGIDIGYCLHLSNKSGVNINLGYHDYLLDFYESDGFSSSVRKVGLSVGYFHTL